MKTPEDEAFEEIERIQRTRTRWVAVKKPQDEIIDMGIQAGLCDKFGSINMEYDYGDQILAFAKLVAAKEREACARVCEETDDGTPYNLAEECARNIRARGEVWT